MRQREFIAGVAGAAAWPVVVGAQQSGMPLIGFLGMDESGSRRRQTSEAFEDRFREGLKAEGYIEGQNVKIDWRWANRQPAGVAAIVYELIRSMPVRLSGWGALNRRCAAMSCSRFCLVSI